MGTQASATPSGSAIRRPLASGDAEALPELFAGE
jgi:hypothetical protein